MNIYSLPSTLSTNSGGHSHIPAPGMLVPMHDRGSAHPSTANMEALTSSYMLNVAVASGGMGGGIAPRVSRMPIIRQNSMVLGDNKELSTMPYDTEHINPLEMVQSQGLSPNGRISHDDITTVHLPDVPELPEKQISKDSMQSSSGTFDSKPATMKSLDIETKESEDSLVRVESMTFDLKGGDNKKMAVLFEYHNMLKHNQNIRVASKNLVFFAAILLSADIAQAASSEKALLSALFCFIWACVTVTLLESVDKLYFRHFMMTLCTFGFLVFRMVLIKPEQNEIDPWYAMIPAGIWLVKSGFGWAVVNLTFAIVHVTPT